MESFKEASKIYFSSKAIAKDMSRSSISSVPEVDLVPFQFEVSRVPVGHYKFGASKNRMTSNLATDPKIAEYLFYSVWESTCSLYKAQWVKFKLFCRSRQLPVSASSITSYLIAIAERTGGKASLLTAKSAIKFFFKLLNLAKKCPTDSWLVSRIASSIKKKYSKPVLILIL